MGRNEDHKAQAMLDRFVQLRRNRSVIQPSFLSSLPEGCNSLAYAEEKRWDITELIALKTIDKEQLQQQGEDESLLRIQELTDEIERLKRERDLWISRILELDGYRRLLHDIQELP